MSWTTIASQDVLDELTPNEVATLQNIQGVTDALDTIVPRVLKQMRSMINAGGNQLDQTGVTIPDALVEDAIAIARWRWILSFPALKFLATDNRKDAWDRAEKRLAGIASQEPARERTELPAVVDTTPVPLIQPSVKPKPLKYKRENQEGII